MTLPPLAKSLNPWIVGLMVFTNAATTAATVYGISLFSRADEKPSSSPAPTSDASARRITALGRIEPRTEVVRLSPPLTLEGDRVAELMVKQGDRVKAGQVIAVLDSRDRLQVALLEAQEQVMVAQSRLAQVEAGAKTGEVQAQKATVVKLQAELRGEIATQQATITRRQSEFNNALAEYNRFQTLYQQGAISASELDRKRLALDTTEAQLKEDAARQNRTLETLQAQIREARATLSQIAEVRPVDLQASRSEVDKALAAMKRAEIDLKQAYIRAPIDGQILKIHSKPGEDISANGIVDLAQTNDMVVVAEVYQTDISQVRVGQVAAVTSQAFEGEIKGTVSEVGLAVNRQDIFNAQPGENLDRRVIEVKIRLSPKESKRVSTLTNLQVQVAIDA